MRNRVFLTIILTAITYGCQREYELKLEFSSGISVNCILDPDSTFRVKISWTERIGHSGPFLPVYNAFVEITEGNTNYTLNGSAGGIYETGIRPVNGKTYQVKADVSGYTAIEAKTTIPSPPIATVVQNAGDNTYTITLINNPHEKNHYWIYAQSGYYQGVFMAPPIKVFNQSVNTIFTNTLIADKFNREKDTSAQGMDYSHSYGMRIPDYNITNGTVTFDIKISDGWNRLERILIVSTDENLDKYLKTGLLQRIQKAGGDTPVFMIPISMFTNIENGKGIFGSCSVVSFDFEFSHE
jgi:hypothetical protein